MWLFSFCCGTEDQIPNKMIVDGVISIQNIELFPTKTEILTQLPGIPVHIEHDTLNNIGEVISVKGSLYDPSKVVVTFEIYDDVPTLNFNYFREIGLGLTIKMTRLSLHRGVNVQDITINELSIMRKNSYPGNYILSVRNN